MITLHFIMGDLNNLIFTSDSTTFEVLESLDLVGVGVELAAIRQTLSEYASDLHTLSTTLSVVDARSQGNVLQIDINRLDITNLRARILTLENTYSSLNSQVNTLQGTLLTVMTTVDSHNSRIAALEARDETSVEVRELLTLSNLSFLDPRARFNIRWCRTTAVNQQADEQSLRYSQIGAFTVVINSPPLSNRIYTGASYNFTISYLDNGNLQNRTGSGFFDLGTIQQRVPVRYGDILCFTFIPGGIPVGRLGQILKNESI